MQLILIHVLSNTVHLFLQLFKILVLFKALVLEKKAQKIQVHFYNQIYLILEP